MTYIDQAKLDGLIKTAKRCGMRVDEKALAELVGYDDDPQEADDEIGLSLTDTNESAHYYHSTEYMGENEQTFSDLFKAALDKLQIRDYEEKSEYIADSKSEDVEIRIGDAVYNYNFKYGWASDAELLAAFAAIAANHSDKKIVHIEGLNQSYILFVPADLANYLHENFTFMQQL